MLFWRNLANIVQRYLCFYFCGDIALDLFYGLCSIPAWLDHRGLWSVWWLELKSIVSCFSPLRSTLYLSNSWQPLGLRPCHFFHVWSSIVAVFTAISSFYRTYDISVNNSPGFVISRFYQQILLTPTSFLIALSMTGSVTVTCLSTWKLLPPPQLIGSLLTSYGTASKGFFWNENSVHHSFYS